LRAIPLADFGNQSPVGLVWRRKDELSPVAQRFAEILRQLAAT
jgi:DNA-binding transcriptional LysR family regulator